jgi:hypothetical protein
MEKSRATYKFCQPLRTEEFGSFLTSAYKLALMYYITRVGTLRTARYRPTLPPGYIRKIKVKVKRAPRTAEQKARLKRERGKKKDLLSEGVKSWHQDTLARAETIGLSIGRTQRYVLNYMMNDGAEMVRGRVKINSFNAFKSIRMAELNEGELSSASSLSLHWF